MIVSEFAKIRGVSESTIYNWHKAGYLNSSRMDSGKIILDDTRPEKTSSEIKAIKESKGISHYEIDHDYFKKANPNMYYIIGFIAADGCIYNNSCCITLHNKDISILEFIKNEIKYTGKIRRFTQRTAYTQNEVQEYIDLRFSSKEIKNDLKKYGIIPRKTMIYKIPENIPKEYINHYIRGYFDGDGSCCYQKNKEGYDKLYFRFRGTEDFCKRLKKIYSDVNQYDVGCVRKSGSTYEYQITGIKSPIDFGDWMYENSIPENRMKRKFDVYQTFKENKKERYNSGLNYKKAEEIREMYKTGNYSHQKIAEIYGVCRQSISYIIAGKLWNKHLS